MRVLLLLLSLVFTPIAAFAKIHGTVDDFLSSSYVSRYCADKSKINKESLTAIEFDGSLVTVLFRDKNSKDMIFSLKFDNKLGEVFSEELRYHLCQWQYEVDNSFSCDASFDDDIGAFIEEALGAPLEKPLLQGMITEFKDKRYAKLILPDKNININISIAQHVTEELVSPGRWMDDPVIISVINNKNRGE